MSLPTIRVLAVPEPGFGFDARLRLGLGCNCFMTAESFLSGRSYAAFGIEPRQVPWFRITLAPMVKCALRVPLARISEYKYIIGGTSMTIFENGALTNPVRALIDTTMNDRRKVGWPFLKACLEPLGEIEHRNTILGILLDEKQRTAFRTALASASKHYATKRGRIMPGDPRIPPDLQRMQIERNRFRYPDGAGPVEESPQPPILSDELRRAGWKPRQPADLELPPQLNQGFERPPAFVLAAFNGSRSFCLGP